MVARGGEREGRRNEEDVVNGEGKRTRMGREGEGVIYKALDGWREER